MSSKTPIHPPLPIARELLAYLVEHPMAHDTLEGMVEWWLLEQEIHRRTAEVKTALAGLLEQGLVITRKGRDGRIRYRINQHKIKEIHILLSTDHTHDK